MRAMSGRVYPEGAKPVALEGEEDVEVEEEPMDDGAFIAGTQVVALGALAIGNVKYQVQNRLLVRMVEGGKARNLDFADAFDVAREVLA